LVWLRKPWQLTFRRIPWLRSGRSRPIADGQITSIVSQLLAFVSFSIELLRGAGESLRLTCFDGSDQDRGARTGRAEYIRRLAGSNVRSSDSHALPQACVGKVSVEALVPRGKESYVTTDRTNRCLSLVWWRECLARWRRFATSRNPTTIGAAAASQIARCRDIKLPMPSR
jgi:hypothetical protein